MSVAHSVAGIITLELTSANIPIAIDFLCKNGISLWDVSYLDDLTVRFRLQRSSYRKLRKLLENRGDSYRLVSREGLYWKFYALTRRPLLISGFVIFLFLMFYIPSRIFFVEVEGNSAVCSNQILSVASDLGVRFGASRRFVKSEQVKNGLLSVVKELEWASVNTKGCVATISVREHSQEEGLSELQGVADMVAIRDGVVLSCDVTRGSALCVQGQAVKAGDVLISGTMDQGFATVSAVAEGEVFASTERKILVKMDSLTQKRQSIRGQKDKYSLLIGKKLINFFKCSGISGGTCVKMYSKYVLTLPGGFCLPVALVKQSLVFYDLFDEQMDESRAHKLLSDFSSRYIRDRMIAGQILTAREETSLRRDAYQLTGTYACAEMIGRVQQEKIGAYNGKTD